jgi:hypothetical protein
VVATEAEAAGVELLGSFKTMYKTRTVVGASGGKNKSTDLYTGISIPTPHLIEAINRSLGKDFVLMTATVKDLTPGHLYRTRLKGVSRDSSGSSSSSSSIGISTSIVTTSSSIVIIVVIVTSTATTTLMPTTTTTNNTTTTPLPYLSG